VEEFFSAAQDKFGKNILIQFEDFGNKNAFRLLESFRNRACTFNDDIQGTASVALAGLKASNKITNKSLSDHTFLFLGAGEAGTGIAKLIAYAISMETGVPMKEARKKIFFFDSKGLVCKARLSQLQEHKIDYAHEFEHLKTLIDAIKKIRPSVLIGVSGRPNTFTVQILEEMARINDRPIIFALSNPTSKAECTAQDAYEHTNGRAVFSSGSPFAPVTIHSTGETFVPGQGNNAYIFPAIGLGVLASGSTKITDYDMYIAANALAEQVSDEQLASGCIYPPLSDIRDFSAKIAARIAANAYKTNVATNFPQPEDLLAYFESIMYDPFADAK